MVDVRGPPQRILRCDSGYGIGTAAGCKWGLQRQKSVCDRTVPFFITDMRKRKMKLVLSVFAREIEFMDVIEGECKTNQIFLDGYICKSRFTGKLLLAEKLRIYCLRSTDLWKIRLHTLYLLGQKCQICQQFYRRLRCLVWGRIQSREYMKRYRKRRRKTHCLRSIRKQTGAGRRGRRGGVSRTAYDKNQE